MPEHSKIAQEIKIAPMLRDLLVGNTGRKMVSASVLLIVAFLIHIKNKRPDYELMKPERGEKSQGKKKVCFDKLREVKAM
jgi:hypothetical protein